MSEFVVIFGVVLAVLLANCVAAQKVHVVGDTIGWAIPQNGAAAYSTWASSNKFVVGDILTFNFATNAHDVLQVPKESFDGCSSANPIGTNITVGPANVTITSEGDLYYICTFGQHCQRGQKLAITVSAASPGAAPSADTPPPPPPSTTSHPPPAHSPNSPAGGPDAHDTSPPPSSPPSPVSSSSSVMGSFVFSFLSVVVGLFCPI
ncbi:hypothetical protein UlMin_017404 [Ulmus minor]